MGPIKRIALTIENIGDWPVFKRLLEDKKIKFDSKGVLRYIHGAPVGELILVGINKKDGVPEYKESAKDWFESESQKAKEFVWP